MQLRVKPSAWITISGLSPTWTLSTARNRISSSVLWSRARASRRFMPHYNQCLLTYALVNTLEIGDTVPIRDGVVGVVTARFAPSGERRNEVHYVVELRAGDGDD